VVKEDKRGLCNVHNDAKVKKRVEGILQIAEEWSTTRPRLTGKKTLPSVRQYGEGKN